MIEDYRLERWEGFKDYFTKMRVYGDCDPSYPALNYICDRLELNKEQRHWIAFLYGITYCVPTTFYIYNEFPDFENVDLNRMQRWWDKNKSKLLFQTDRAKIKNFNFFVKVVSSYKDLIGNSTQEQVFKNKDYDKLYKFCNKIYYFGRFSLFNYLESLHELCDIQIQPTGLNFKEAESSRNGFCYACGKDNFITMHHKKSKDEIDYAYLQTMLEKMKDELKENKEIEANYWNIETVLCAYKKLFWESRYFGYYIDRIMEEIIFMEKQGLSGVDWSVLWDFRKEYFCAELLGELNGWKGIRKPFMKYFNLTGKILRKELPARKFKKKVEFQTLGEVYGVEGGKINE